MGEIQPFKPNLKQFKLFDFKHDLSNSKCPFCGKDLEEGDRILICVDCDKTFPK